MKARGAIAISAGTAAILVGGYVFGPELVQGAADNARDHLRSWMDEKLPDPGVEFEATADTQEARFEFDSVELPSEITTMAISGGAANVAGKLSLRAVIDEDDEDSFGVWIGDVTSTTSYKSDTEVSLDAMELGRFTDHQEKTMELFVQAEDIQIETNIVNGSLKNPTEMTRAAGFLNWVSSGLNMVEQPNLGVLGISVGDTSSDFTEYYTWLAGGLAIKSGLGVQDNCIREQVIPYSDDIIATGVYDVFYDLVKDAGYELTVTIVDEDGDKASPAQIRESVQIVTKLDDELAAELANIDTNNPRKDKIITNFTAKPRVACELDESIQERLGLNESTDTDKPITEKEAAKRAASTSANTEESTRD